jgi:hypothetical protein
LHGIKASRQGEDRKFEHRDTEKMRGIDLGKEKIGNSSKEAQRR